MSFRHGTMNASNEKAKNLSKTLSTLLNYLKPFRIAIVFVIIFAVGSTIFTIIGPKILGNATTKLVQGLIAKYSGTGSIDIDGIKHTLLLLLCIYILSGILSYIQVWIMSGVTQKVTYRLREEISLKINRLPLNYYDKQTHGEVLSRITNDVDTMSQSLTQSIQMIFTSLITIIGILYMMITISWQMTLMALVIVPFSAVAAMSVVKNGQKYFIQQQETLGEVNGHIEEMYGGHIVMKAFNGEERSISTFNKMNEELYTSAWKSQFISG